MASGMKFLRRNIVAELVAVLMGAAMAVEGASAQDTQREPIRIFQVNGVRLYVPQTWFASDLSASAPAYDPKMPEDTVFVSARGIMISFKQYRFYGDFEYRKPALWPDFDVIHAIFDTGVVISESDFREKYVENSIPKNTNFDCNKSDYKNEKALGVCIVHRRVLNGIRMRYQWDGKRVNPDEWPRMDMRVQKAVEWLATPPDKRPAVIPD